MNFLLFSGPQGAGKTPSITRYKNHLVSVGYTISDFVSLGAHDFRCLLTKNDRKIIIWSATDNKNLINDLVLFISTNSDAEAVVVSCRSFDVDHRQYQFQKLQLNSPSNAFFEIPLGRQINGNNRNKSLGWYLDSILKTAIIIGSQKPFMF